VIVSEGVQNKTYVCTVQVLLSPAENTIRFTLVPKLIPVNPNRKHCAAFQPFENRLGMAILCRIFNEERRALKARKELIRAMEK
jgi:hypothetical protein